MTKLKGLLLTEGMHGMISQVEGLAKALNLEFIHEKIELNNFWKMIPPKLTPVKDFVFKNNISEKFNVVISCGRKSVVPSIFLKKKFGSKIMNIHIQDPKVSLNNFDFVIAPEHDGLEGKNVLKTKGAIHYLTEKELEENVNYLKPRIKKEKVIAFIAGGPNNLCFDKKTVLSSLVFVMSYLTRLIFDNIFSTLGSVNVYFSSSLQATHQSAYRSIIVMFSTLFMFS